MGEVGDARLQERRTEGHDESDREQNITVRADRGRPSPLLRSWFTVHLNANHNNAVGHQGGQMLSAAGKNRRSYSPRGHGQLRCPNLLDVRTHGRSLYIPVPSTSTSSGFRTESDRNFRAAFRAAGFLAARAAGFFFKSVPHSRPPSSRFSSRFSSRRLS